MLAEIGLPPTHQMPRDLWRWTVAVSDIANLSPAPPSLRSSAIAQCVASSSARRSGAVRLSAPSSTTFRAPVLAASANVS